MQQTEFTHGLAQRLIGRQNADGGWAAVETGASATEPTAWALRALARVSPDTGEPEAPGVDARARALNWLVERQLPSGAWPGSERVPESGSSTAVASLALATCAEPELQDRAVSGAGWLLVNTGRQISWWTRLWLRWNPDRSPIDIDTKLRGWPWMRGMWGWVEPTSITLIVLRTLHERLPQRAVDAAIESGESFLFDRTCPGGGWNYGMGRTHDEDLWPYPDTTAFALLALGPGRSEPAVAEGLGALRTMLEQPVSRLATALGIFALDRHGLDVQELHRRLIREWGDPFPAPTTRTLALSLMAAGGDGLVAPDGTTDSLERRTDG